MERWIYSIFVHSDILHNSYSNSWNRGLMCDCGLFFLHFPQHKGPDSFQSNLLNCPMESLILAHPVLCAHI